MHIDHQCMYCRHFHKEDLERNSCDAFPAGIPEEIIDNVFIHDKKHPSQDNDVLFEED